MGKASSQPSTHALREGDVHDLVVEDIAPKGDGVAYLDGVPIYVAQAIPGERVRVRLRRPRRGWAPGDLEEVLEPSPDRVAPPCPLFDACAGCQLQHVDYPRQAVLKRRIVQIQLERFGDFVDAPVSETIAAEEPFAYRNHARFTVREGRLGFVRRFRRHFLEVARCAIMDERINEVLAQFQGELDGATQCNVRVGAPPQPVMIQPALPDAPRPTGQPRMTHALMGHSFVVSAPSFFQVNHRQAEALVRAVMERVGNAELVVDAYAGVGTFAVLLSPHVGRVVAIEEAGPAVEDARVNAAGLANVELRLGRAEEVLLDMTGDAMHVDAVVLDPPRCGCRRVTLDAVLALAPRRVIYVSCDPATLARDLRILVDRGLKLTDVQPLDMFPQTHHVECIATLDRY